MGRPLARCPLVVGWLWPGGQPSRERSGKGATHALLRPKGGPEGRSAALRARGEQSARLDRWEPDMRLVFGEDPQDSASPAAMAAAVGRHTLGPALPEARRSSACAAWR